MAKLEVALINLPRSSGIYEIVNKKNGKRYIGSAVRLRNRWLDHRKNLRRGIHANRYLSRAWKLYGEQAFVFRVLELCDAADLIAREQRALDIMKPAYNACKIAGSPLGLKVGDETRAKQSASAKARWARATKKDRFDFGAMHKRLWRNRNHREKMSVAQRAGWTPEAKAKKAAAMAALWKDKSYRGKVLAARGIGVTQ